MRIISVELKNIRSYRDAVLELSDGITLLSGDIGVGKSTLLLAIEFALFGLSRGELVGNALLRHGASDGRVTLTFGIHTQEYTISRTLKRSASGVQQESGYIETNGSREILTPGELRARIFELLGYPLQFLQKQRNLLYRFTIYTPQEEMKSILVQQNEERLETIRRIFGIDAYRIARDNAHLLAKALREREVVAEAMLPRMQQEERQLTERLKREPEIARTKARLALEREQILKRLSDAETHLATLEKERVTLQHEQQMALMQERARKVIEQELRGLAQQLERKERSLRETSELVQKLRTTHELFTKELDGAPTVAEIQAQQKAALGELELLKLDEGKVLAILEQCRHGPDIAPGVPCPTCKQEVSESYLDDLKSSLAAQGDAAKRKQERLLARVAEQRALLVRLQGSLDRRRQIDDVAVQLKLQESMLQQHEQEVKLLQQTIAAKQASMPAAILPDEQRVRRSTELERNIVERKAEVSRYRGQLTEVEKHTGRIEQEEQELANARERLVVLGAEKLQHEQAHMRTAQIRNWIQRQFTPFAATVERHVLMSIHMTFDAVFRQWFNRLIEDDALSTRIDHEFAPVMLQHGYETDVAYLSGGERTAVSLAYRLALVHTIHVMLPNLGTSGVIMLDEPTDGFSAEQLERVRDVLRELRMHQIILVSHEQQLEGFVDHILRVRKTGDGSVVEVAA